MSVLNCTLNLVYPPISNQEGVWLWENKEVREYVKDSKLYMLVHRKELKFAHIDEGALCTGTFKFKLTMGEFKTSFFQYEFSEELKILLEDNIGSLLVEAGDKLFRITEQENDEILYWATPDKMLFDAEKGNIQLQTQNIKDIEGLQEFELLYVGISKKVIVSAGYLKKPTTVD